MGEKIKIILTDDEVDFRTLMSFWLKSKGYEVITASDGREAVELVEKENPDILLLDLNMPVMSGAEVLKEIRKFNKTLPVIIISAHVNSPEAMEAMPYGVSGVFYKGKDFEEALTLLETAIRMQKKRRERSP